MCTKLNPKKEEEEELFFKIPELSLGLSSALPMDLTQSSSCSPTENLEQK